MLLLSSCEWDNNFFYHPVDFKGVEEDSELVVIAHLEAGSTPRVMVNRSYFFKYSTATGTDPDDNLYYIDYDGDTVYAGSYGLNRGWLKDATVEMQIDGGPWEKLTCGRDTLCTNEYSAMYEVVYSYRSSRVLHEGELVNLRVSHPDFPKQATASQRIPMSARAELLSVSDPETYNICFKLQIPEYQGADEEVMCFRATTYMSYIDVAKHLNEDSTYSLPGDTIGISIYTEHYVYGQDVNFSRYDNINKQLSLGYWGSNHVGLFCSANRYGTDITLPIRAFYEPLVEYDYGTSYTGYRTDSIVLEVRMMSRDAYLQTASMVAAGYMRVSVSDLWKQDDFFDIGDLIGEIEEVFSELGTLEGVQVFSNVEGGFGHVTASSVQRFVFVPQEEALPEDYRMY